MAALGGHWLDLFAQCGAGYSRTTGCFSVQETAAFGDDVGQFLHQCDGPMEIVDWQQKLEARTVGYDGSEVYTAERPALIGVGGSVNAAAVSTAFVRDALLDPSLVWRLDRPNSERPRNHL